MRKRAVMLPVRWRVRRIKSRYARGLRAETTEIRAWRDVALRKEGLGLDDGRYIIDGRWLTVDDRC